MAKGMGIAGKSGGGKGNVSTKLVHSVQSPKMLGKMASKVGKGKSMAHN